MTQESEEHEDKNKKRRQILIIKTILKNFKSLLMNNLACLKE